MESQINISRKTGFRNVTGNRVIINDPRGIVFYDTNDVDGRVRNFNLPPGNYILVQGKIRAMPEPVNYQKIKLPPNERKDKPDPEKFPIEFDSNPYKASVLWNAGEREIVLDHRFKQAPLPVVMTVLEHEYAHRFYSTEKYCDAMAYNKMIERGYNPSQVLKAFITILSKKQDYRKEYMLTETIEKDNLVQNYDIITIGGVQYSVNQILDKTIIANKDLKTYSRPGGTELGSVKKGQPIGKVFSYLRPDQGNGYAWLMFESTYNKYFYVPADGANISALKDQGTKTVTQEIKEEKEKERQQSDPWGYYIEKYGFKLLLVVGAIALLSGAVREGIKKL